MESLTANIRLVLERANAGPDRRALADLERLEREITVFRSREERLEKALKLTEDHNGEWGAAVDQCVRDLDEARARVAALVEAARLDRDAMTAVVGLISTAVQLGEPSAYCLQMVTRTLVARLTPPAAQAEQADPEKWLRLEWWANHGCSMAVLYGDDGELQCSRCLVDFKRHPIAELREFVRQRRLQQLPPQGALSVSPAVASVCGAAVDQMRADDEYRRVHADGSGATAMEANAASDAWFAATQATEARARALPPALLVSPATSKGG